MTERLLALAGGGPPPAPPWLTLTERDRARVAAWLAERGVQRTLPRPRSRSPLGHQALAILPPSWQNGSSAEIVVVGGTEDLAAGEAIVARTAGRARSAVGQLTLRESAAMVERAHCVITNDSLALHLASALGRPVVAIFGPTTPAFGFGPRQADDLVVELPSLPCRPCSSHGPARCPLGHHRCMRNLGIAAVLAAVEQRLQQIGLAGPIAGWR